MDDINNTRGNPQFDYPVRFPTLIINSLFSLQYDNKIKGMENSVLPSELEFLT